MKNISAYICAVGGYFAAINVCLGADLIELPNWSGLYIGITVGTAQSSVEALPPYDPAVLAPFAGTFGGNIQSGNSTAEGLVIGYDHQTGPAVFGILAEINHANIATSGTWTDEFEMQPWETKLDWLGSVRGRVGITAHKVLFYGTGGVAFTDGKIRNWNYEGDGNRTFAFKSVGFVLGAGAEMMITPKWSANIDYSHYMFRETNDTQIFSDEHEGPELGGRNHLSVDEVKVGINYRF